MVRPVAGRWAFGTVVGAALAFAACGHGGGTAGAGGQGASSASTAGHGGTGGASAAASGATGPASATGTGATGPASGTATATSSSGQGGGCGDAGVGFDAGPPAASHADYYVAKGVAGASDANDGTSPTVGGGHGPWATIGHAVSVAGVGDVVHVGDGTYAEDVDFSTSGAMGTPLVLAAAAGASPQVRSITVRGQWVEVLGFTVVGPDALPASWQDMPAIVVDDPTVGPIDPSLPLATRDDLRWQKYASYMGMVATTPHNGMVGEYTNYTNGIRTVGASHVVIGGNTVSQHTTCFGLYQDKNGVPSTFVTVTYNHGFHCRSGVWAYASSGTSATDSSVTLNHFDQNLSNGIDVRYAARITIEANVVEYIGICPVTVSYGTSDSTVRANTLREGGYYTETMDYPGSSAISLFQTGTGNVVERNFIAYQHDVTGYDGNGVIDDTSNAGVVVQNNVIFRTQGSGVTNTQSYTCTIVNNTIVEPGYMRPPTGNGACVRSREQAGQGNTIANNVCYHPAAAAVHIEGMLSAQALLDYDLYAVASGVPVAQDNGGTYTTLAALGAATTWESHGVAGDPAFVDEANGDVRVQSGSPAIGAADPAHAPKDDFLGVPRGSPPDMGAYQLDADPACP